MVRETAIRKQRKMYILSVSTAFDGSFAMSLDRGEVKINFREKVLLVSGRKNELGKRFIEFMRAETLHAMEFDAVAFQNLGVAGHCPMKVCQPVARVSVSYHRSLRNRYHFI